MTIPRLLTLMLLQAMFILFAQSPSVAQAKYQKIHFEATGDIDIVQYKEGSTSFVHVYTDDKSFTVSYPSSYPAPQLTTKSWGVEITAPDRFSFDIGTCLPGYHLNCDFWQDGTVTCQCIPGGSWCDTALEGEWEPIETVHIAGAGCS